MTTTDTQPKGETLEPVLLDRNDVLDTVALFCSHFETLGERFKKQLRNTIRAIPPRHAAVAGPRRDGERMAAMFTELYNCYTASKCAAAEKGEHDDYQHLKGMAEAYQDAAKRCQLFAATSSPTPAEGTCAKCGGSGEIVIGCAVGHPLTAPCPECSAKRAQTAGEQDASRWVKNKLRPEHKCKPLARAVMMEGRDWWIGELLEPVADWPNETHCLHMKTPLKDVSFLCNAGDFEQLMVLCNVLVKLENLTWLRATTAGAKARLRPPFTETEGDHR